MVTEDTYVKVFLTNATFSGELLPSPTFSPGNGPQDTAKGNVNIDPAEWAEGTYSEFAVPNIRTRSACGS